MIVARRPLRGAFLFASSLAALACSRTSADANAKADSTKVAAAAAASTVHADSVWRAPFGTAPDGTPVEVFTLTNRNGVEARILSYGGILQSLKTPDKTGAFDDVVLGFDDLAGYVKSSPYFGAIVGRYGNRIARGRFTLDGKTYKLAINNPPNSLHGGVKGFDKVVWHAEPFRNDSGVGVILTHTRDDPGNLDHVVASQFALQARMSAQAVGRQGGRAIGSPEIPGMTIGGPQVYCFEPHQSELCSFKPDTLLDITSVWEQKWAAIQCIASQPLMWEHYRNMAMQRGSVARGRPKYAEAYQRLFPSTVQELL